MAKILNDKYYTPEELAKYCIDKTFEIIGRESISNIIEPSAGNGVFSNLLKCTAYDIEPGNKDIIKQDFLKLDLSYKEGTLVIGNPPFGKSNSLSVKFFNKSCEIADYISFIQPISQLNNNLQMYKFDLIYSEDLGLKKYTDRELHCCLNIYKRPKNKDLNKKPDFKLKDVTIKEYRRNGSYRKPENFHFAICNWGCLGKVPDYVGHYAQEAYFIVNNMKHYDQIKRLLEFNTIREYVNSISAKKISVMRLYKYLKDNIEGIE